MVKIKREDFEKIRPLRGSVFLKLIKLKDESDFLPLLLNESVKQIGYDGEDVFSDFSLSDIIHLMKVVFAKNQLKELFQIMEDIGTTK
ncbi:MAG: hypothetical protein QHH15_06225 [Candidatus Thermoplasmatota archaeon]|nr:hypothetical protein [Candidatus Thermoplasmatota archaeon]